MSSESRFADLGQPVSPFRLRHSRAETGPTGAAIPATSAAVQQASNHFAIRFGGPSSWRSAAAAKVNEPFADRAETTTSVALLAPDVSFGSPVPARQLGKARAGCKPFNKCEEPEIS